MDRAKNIQLIVLVILVIGAFGYIGYDKFTDINEAKQVSIFNQGAEYAIVQIAQNVATCQQVPLIVGNQTINLIAVECLQQQVAE